MNRVLFLGRQTAIGSPRGIELSAETWAEPWKTQVRVKRNLNLTDDPRVAQPYIKDDPPSSTKEVKTSDEIDKMVESIFRAAESEEFEDGMVSFFQKSLKWLTICYGSQVLTTIVSIILYGRCSEEVAAQTLKCMGQLNHLPTKDFRFWILVRCLKNEAWVIRDGALIGISYTKDMFFIPYLEQALVDEKHKGLCKDLEKVLSYLKSLR